MSKLIGKTLSYEYMSEYQDRVTISVDRSAGDKFIGSNVTVGLVDVGDDSPLNDVVEFKVSCADFDEVVRTYQRAKKETLAAFKKLDGDKVG